MLWVTLVIIVVFGGATLALHDETFIKWKPTVVYWLFAVALTVSDLVFKKNLMRAVLEKNMTLPELVWRRVNLSWVVFFAVMGVLNLFVAYHFATDTWVNFKVFGGIGLMLLFMLAQGLILSKHISEKDTP
jgi:intracellular septation protein